MTTQILTNFYNWQFLATNAQTKIVSPYQFLVSQDCQKDVIKLTLYGLTRKNKIVTFSPTEYKIGYAISTDVGQSGSPVVSSQKIIAIHNGSGVDKKGKKQYFNVGRLMTTDLFKNLSKWSVQLSGDPFQLSRQLCRHQENSDSSEMDQFSDQPHLKERDGSSNKKINPKNVAQKHQTIKQKNQNDIPELVLKLQDKALSKPYVNNEVRLFLQQKIPTIKFQRSDRNTVNYAEYSHITQGINYNCLSQVILLQRNYAYLQIRFKTLSQPLKIIQTVQIFQTIAQQALISDNIFLTQLNLEENRSHKIQIFKKTRCLLQV